MKIKDLIEKLNTYDPEKTVYMGVGKEEGDGFSMVKTDTYFHENNGNLYICAVAVEQKE